MKKLIFAAIATLAFGACNGSSNNSAPAPAPAPATVSNAINDTTTALTPSGDTAATSLVTSQNFCAGESCAASDDAAWTDIFNTHPGLQDNFATLKSIDHVILTSAGTYDLYAGDTLLMTLSPNTDGTWAVSATTSDMDIQNVTLQNSAATDQQQASLDSIVFELQSCMAADQQQQGQDQQQQGKDDQAQQGKRGDDQSQQGKGEVKPQCDLYDVTLFLQLQPSKDQNQEQGKDQQQQGKDDQSQQGKDQGNQAQGK